MIVSALAVAAIFVLILLSNRGRPTTLAFSTGLALAGVTLFFDDVYLAVDGLLGGANVTYLLRLLLFVGSSLLLAVTWGRATGALSRSWRRALLSWVTLWSGAAALTWFGLVRTVGSNPLISQLLSETVAGGSFHFCVGMAWAAGAAASCIAALKSAPEGTEGFFVNLAGYTSGLSAFGILASVWGSGPAAAGLLDLPYGFFTTLRDAASHASLIAAAVAFAAPYLLVLPRLVALEVWSAGQLVRAFNIRRSLIRELGHSPVRRSLASWAPSSLLHRTLIQSWDCVSLDPNPAALPTGRGLASQLAQLTTRFTDLGHSVSPDLARASG